jgi:hypothetical protein
MYYDVECPYCGKKQNIDHEDGYGYKEDELYQQQCEECDNYFTYTTIISFDYYVSKADCLNGGNHVFKSTRHYPVEYTKMRCDMCGEERNPTEEEWVEIHKSRKNN